MRKITDEDIAEEETYRTQLKSLHGRSFDEVQDRIEQRKDKEREEYEQSLEVWNKRLQDENELKR